MSFPSSHPSPPGRPIAASHLPPPPLPVAMAVATPVAPVAPTPAPAPATAAGAFIYGCMLPTVATGLAYFGLFMILPLEQAERGKYTGLLAISAPVLLLVAGLCLGRLRWGWSMLLAGLAAGLVSAPVTGVGAFCGLCFGGIFGGPTGLFVGGAIGALFTTIGMGALGYWIIRFMQRHQAPPGSR